jgi:hypothetical protein
VKAEAAEGDKKSRDSRRVAVTSAPDESWDPKLECQLDISEVQKKSIQPTSNNCNIRAGQTGAGGSLLADYRSKNQLGSMATWRCKSTCKI